MDFPAQLLPPWLARFVEAVAESTQTPVDLAGMVALGILATVLAGKIEVEVAGDWHEPANLYVVVALPPGERKSAVFGLCVSPIVQLERELTDRTELERLQSELRGGITEGLMKRAQRRAAIADTELEREEATTEALQHAEELAVNRPGPRPRLFTADATPEAVGRLLAENHGRVAILSSEGELFALLAGRYSKSPNLEVFLKGHAGDPIRVDRRNGPPEIVDRPALTVAVTVQPDVLLKAGLVSEFRARGVFARMLFSFPTTNVGYRSVRSEPIPAKVMAEYDTRVRELGRLEASLDVTGDQRAYRLHLTSVAMEKFTQFRASLEERLRPGGDLRDSADWANKLAGALMRIAGLLHVAAGGPAVLEQTISEETVTNALAFSDYLIAHAKVGLAIAGSDPRSALATRTLAWVRSRSLLEFTQRDAHRALHGSGATPEEVGAVLSFLEQHEYVRELGSERRQGRPSRRFIVNPEVHERQNLAACQNPLRNPVSGGSDPSVTQGGDSEALADPPKLEPEPEHPSEGPIATDESPEVKMGISPDAAQATEPPPTPSADVSHVRTASKIGALRGGGDEASYLLPLPFEDVQLGPEEEAALIRAKKILGAHEVPSAKLWEEANALCGDEFKTWYAVFRATGKAKNFGDISAEDLRRVIARRIQGRSA
jgi:hypothetical protein